jgi:hypothetical protein
MTGCSLAEGSIGLLLGLIIILQKANSAPLANDDRLRLVKKSELFKSRNDGVLNLNFLFVETELTFLKRFLRFQS